MVFAIVAGVILILLLLLFISGVRVIRQAEAAVVERFGAYLRTMNVGIHIVIRKSDRFRTAAGHHKRQCHHDDRFGDLLSDYGSETVRLRRRQSHRCYRKFDSYDTPQFNRSAGA